MKEIFRGLLTNDYNEANIVLYGVPFDQNCSISSGSYKAPSKLRELSGWIPPYTMDGKSLKNIKIYDNGDIDVRSFEDLGRYSNIFNDAKLKMIFGGDHSISIPFQKAFIEKTLTEGKKPVIVHIDAHCDICDTYLGSKYSHACIVRRALDNGLEQRNLFMIGIREFEQDGYEMLINNKNDVHLYMSSEVLDVGLSRFIKEINEKNNDKYRLYISFGIDSLDSSYAPGTGTPETCGLTPNIVKKILKHLGSFSNVDCIDLVEVAPTLDVNDITSWTGIKLLYEFFGTLEK